MTVDRRLGRIEDTGRTFAAGVREWTHAEFALLATASAQNA